MEIEKIGKKQNKITLTDGTKLVAFRVHSDSYTVCVDCSFNEHRSKCMSVPCISSERLDREPVIFLKVDNG